MSSSRGSYQPEDQIHLLSLPVLAGGFFTTSATWEAQKASRSKWRSLWLRTDEMISACQAQLQALHIS